MVFESIVVDVLNRFLGDYVENLNQSQLKLGIWGGDVVLENLKLKQNALEELNIPVQTVYGHLGKLVLKIPWKNLYGASVEASIERLFLIVTPSAEVVYDPEKEEKMALAAKQAELVRVEEAKKKEAEKDQNKLDETFVEKLVTQIIKNVQLNIKDIHIRYEDSITNPKAPFSFGITLHNLSVHTTDENWKQTVIQDAVTKIFKILDLDGLAIYWNPATELYSKHEEERIRTRLSTEIATKSSQPSCYNYALGPINATAKLKLNPKPEADIPKFSLPKVILTLHMEQLSVNLSKKQYQDMMLLADSMDRMNKGAPYRKYRPNLRTYRGHYKEWWKFAYKCILEEEVRRRRRNWEWTHMLSHRNLCRDYAQAYHCKLSNKGKATQEQQCLLDEAEKKLDLLNLVVIRQRIEMEVERLGKLEAEARKSRGWFSGWWGGGSKDDELAEGTAIMKQFQNAMTPEEKAKLFRAIDYQENSAPLHLPTEYVAVETCFRLDRLQVAVNDGKEVLKACVDNVVVEMGQRPSANAIRVDVLMQAFTVTGVQQGDYEPQLVTSKEVTSDVNLLNVTFETNPLDGKCDQRVRVSARPLQIIYDAQTVIEIVNVFKPETESSALTTLQAVAENKISDLKEKSALGMQHAVHQHSFIDLDIDIAASYIVVSQTGKYKQESPCIVVKLGAIHIKSEPRDDTLDVHKLYKEGLADDQIIQEIARHSYDKLDLRLTEMQIVIALRNEDWQSAIASHEASELHLLQPTNLLIQIHKCLITDDPRLPKIRIRGELQKIAISASEDRLLTLCEILIGMPLPKAEESTQLKATESKGSSLSLLKYLDPVEKQKRDTARAKSKTDEQSVQLTEVEATFVMTEIVLSVNRKKRADGQSYDKFLVFSLYMLELTATQKTFMLGATVRLGSVGMQHHRKGRNVIQMIDTPEVTKTLAEECPVVHSLFAVTYTNVDKKCPEFRSHYGSVEQLIELDFATLRVLLHLEGLQEILVIVNEYQTRMQNLQSTVDRIANAGPLETIIEDEELSAVKSKTSFAKQTRKKQVETIQLKVNVKIGAVEIEFATDRRSLSLVQLQKAAAGLILKSSYTQVDCAISDINVKDLNPATIHKDILKVLGGDVVNVQVVMYNLEQGNSPSDVNMSIDAQINCLRIVFLNWFVTSMLEFLNNFQTAQQAIIEASSQAVESARANVQNAYENSTKLALKVRLAAPIIVVPENSKSKKALLVDLGRMTLQNKFVDLKVENVSNKVTVDELTLELEDIKLSCVSLVDNMTGVKDERKLLKPTSLKMFVKRSLSSWYEHLPDLDLSGRLKTISIRVGHSDYRSIMNILNQNLQEGQMKDVKIQASVPKSTSKAVARTSSRQDTRKVTTATVESAKDEDVKKPRVTIKFSFTMDSFVIDLVNTVVSSGIDGGIEKDIALARFCLALFSVKGRMFSDGSLNTSLLLVDCTLDDTRPDRGAKLTRYLERRRESGDMYDEKKTPIMQSPDKIRSMIDITYTIKNHDTYIDIRVFSFNLILAIDFLNRIADFMKSGLAEESEEEVGDKTLQIANKSDKAVDAFPPVALKKKQTPSNHPVDQAQTMAMMTVNIKIEQPDIILVESLEQKTCDALVLNMEARFKLRKTEERMVADGGISGLQMVIRTLGKAEKNPRYLLEPATLSVALSQPPGAGMHVDVAVSDIKITVSPNIIALLNRVMATMTSSEEDNTQEIDKIIFYSRLWDIAPFKPNQYWFLKTELAEEAMDLEEPAELMVEQKPPSNEICLLSSPSIVLSLEMQIGDETIPVLVMQASLNGQVKDWSSDFYLESTWAMQVSYYNLGRALWEPLIEPVEVLKDYTYKHVPWELKMEVVMRPSVEQSSIDLSDEAANVAQVAHRQANKTITISSEETLEITITRSGMEVLTLLGNSFSAAIADTADQSGGSALSKLNDDKKSKSEYYGAPYVLHNCTGLTAKLLLEDNHDFTVFLADGKPESEYREVVFETGASVPLKLKRGGLNVMKLNEAPPPLSLSVRIVELEEYVSVPVERADKRYFPLGRKQTGSIERSAPHAFLHESRGLISDVVMQEAALHIYLRSVVQVTNNLSVNVSVYYMTLSGNEVRLLGEVKPGAILRLPLQAVHTPTAELFFSVEGFTVSVSPFIWRELQQEVRIAKLLQCDSKDKTSGEKFYLNAIGTMEQVFFENTNRHTFASSCYDIVLKPAVKMQNCLPVDIVVSQLGLNRTQRFKSGEMFHLSHLSPNKASIVIMIQNYLEKCWVCTKNLPDNETELSVWSFESHDSPSLMTLDLGMHSVDSEGTQVLSLYCPFWMLNKTGLTLCYRKSKRAEKDSSSTSNKNVDDTGNVIFHPKEYKEPILFSFRAKNFFGKKKAAIRIEFGEWSEKFSLDVPGSSGVIICRHEGRSYQVAVTNQLTFNSLTKMVIFTPYFLIINEAAFHIEYQELHRSGDPWREVEKNSSAPLWPVVEKDEKLLVLRVADTKELTAPFLYTEQHSSCLKLTNEYGGLHVEVQLSEGGTYITVRQYRDGHAPALLINFCQHTIVVYEKENVNVKKIAPMQKMLYTWDNPAGPRTLIFQGHNKKEIENDLRQDGMGEFSIDNQHRVWWVSFLDGLQRVVLFTDDALLASGAHTLGEAELVDTEIVFAIHGVGLSLVNDPEHLEIIYMTISNSGIIWEQCKLGARRYKKIEGTKLKLYEEAYQKYLRDKLLTDPGPPVYLVDEKIEVNFEEMRVLKPSARLLRRTLEPGLWASLGLTAHSRRLHARLHRLQVDQQLPLPTFPVTLAPVPPPPSVTQHDTGMKPFIEVSIVERIMEHSKVRQYKYYKVLIQEFHVKVDMGLVNALMGMFPQRLLTEQEALEAFQTDLENARQPLEALAAIGVASDIKNFYDNLHLSPLKVHVSFSLGGATQLPSFIGTVLQSIGVTLTDMNDVVFKLSYYERNFEFLSQKELISQVSSHYQGQAIKQLYVLVLGLDVIGNPYGLVVGLKKGVEDLFYEPFQGAIQGPGEFAEGLFLGVRSLVGHTVGGAAGAMSRITGAMGHGLAALSLDKDYQRRRRDNINKPPANLQEGLARSGKGLVMGVFDGVTGVFTKPFEGARSEGVEGFFKGLGRGAVGLVARPTAGVVDFASGSFDAVKRAADMHEETTKRRAARYLPPDTGVRPYSRSQAEGYKMLSELEKGKFVSTDSYEAHVWVIPGKEVVMCTDKRLLYLERNVVFGGWQILWTYLWSEIPEVPTSVNKGVYIPTSKKKVLGMFPSSGSGKVIFLVDDQQKKYLLAHCERLMRSR